MANPSDTRWKQRFENFNRALSRLSDALTDGPQALSELEQEGVVQRFEYTYELGWKTLKDYLQHAGVTIDPITPKQVFKAVFKANLIDTEKVWIDMLNHRNLLAYDYDEEQFSEALQTIFENYLPVLHSLKNRLSQVS